MQRIVALDPLVVSQIAAGEVVHAPSSVVKELLENSLDAQATQISVILGDGGLKLLQIVDDGCGIPAADLPLVCQRHATSKIRLAEDLKCIRTFGFRGEALGSVSHVARVTVASWPHNVGEMGGQKGHIGQDKAGDENSSIQQQQCAFRLSFVDGRPVAPGQWASSAVGKPKPCAGRKGTVITVEDLFYNVATRRKSVGTPAAEHARCIDVLKRYAIANPAVSISVKKRGESTMDMQSRGSSDSLSVIRQVFGDVEARLLLPFSPTVSGDHTITVDGWVTDPLMLKQSKERRSNTFILFVNGRLVTNKPLQKSLYDIYKTVLSFKQLGTSFKGIWLFLKISVDPANVDVNVHPTKEEVHLLDQDNIIRSITRELKSFLLGQVSIQDVEMYTQPAMSLPFAGGHAEPALSLRDEEMPIGKSDVSIRDVEVRVEKQPIHTMSLNQSQRTYGTIPSPDSLVRPRKTGAASGAAPYQPFDEDVSPFASGKSSLRKISDPNQPTLDSMFESPPAAYSQKRLKSVPAARIDQADAHSTVCSSDLNKSPSKGTIASAVCRELVETVTQCVDETLFTRLSMCVFVGSTVIRRTSPEPLEPKFRTMGIFQHGRSVFLLECAAVSREIAYQNLLRSFSMRHFTSARSKDFLVWASPPASVFDLLLIAFDSPRSGYSPTDGAKTDIAAGISMLLKMQAPVLANFGLVLQMVTQTTVSTKSSLHLLAFPRIVHRLKKLPTVAWPISAFVHKLPFLLLDLATRVAWPDTVVGDLEALGKENVESVLAVIADFWCLDDHTMGLWRSQLEHTSDTESAQASEVESGTDSGAEDSTIQVYSQSTVEPVREFVSRSARDNVLWRALDFLHQRSAMSVVDFAQSPYLFRRIDSSGRTHAYLVATPHAIFEQLSTSWPTQSECLEDVVPADSPVKLVLTFNGVFANGTGPEASNKLPANVRQDVRKKIARMQNLAVSLFLAEIATSSASSEGGPLLISQSVGVTWVELDASMRMKDSQWLVRRRCVCSELAFAHQSHLRLFLRKLRDRASQLVSDGDDPFSLTYSTTDASGMIRDELFLDSKTMPVLEIGRNKSLSLGLPWTVAARSKLAAASESPCLWLPVVDDDIVSTAPQLDILVRCLANCGIGAQQQHESATGSNIAHVLAYDADELAAASRAKFSPRSSEAAGTYSLDAVLERVVLPIFHNAEMFLPPKSFRANGEVLELSLPQTELNLARTACTIKH